jgi:hypothetical protein
VCEDGTGWLSLTVAPFFRWPTGGASVIIVSSHWQLPVSHAVCMGAIGFDVLVEAAVAYRGFWLAS